MSAVNRILRLLVEDVWFFGRLFKKGRVYGFWTFGVSDIIELGPSLH